MLKHYYTLLIFIGASFQLNAQFDIDPGSFIDALVGSVESDRPGQALNPTTCGVAAIQLQTGFSYESYNNDKVSKYSHYYVPTNLRFGFTKKWELNTSFYYLNSNYMDTLIDLNSNGFLSPEIGVRYAFMTGKRWKPYLALQANASILSHRGDFQQTHWGSSFYLATSNRFSKMSINTNFGCVFPGNGDMNPNFPWVFNMGWMIGKKFGTFIEGFGEFRLFEVSFDAGFSYVPISDLQIDLFGGMKDLTNQTNRWFAEIGVTYRLSFLKIVGKKKAKEFMGNFGGGLGGN